MYDNVKTTELLNRLLIDADKLAPEVLEALQRFEELLDVLHELSRYQNENPSPEDWDIACREFCEDHIDTFLRG